MWKTCYHKKKFSKEKALRSDKKRGTWETRKLTKIPRLFFCKQERSFSLTSRSQMWQGKVVKPKKFKNHQTEWGTHSNVLILSVLARVYYTEGGAIFSTIGIIGMERIDGFSLMKCVSRSERDYGCSIFRGAFIFCDLTEENNSEWIVKRLWIRNNKTNIEFWFRIIWEIMQTLKDVKRSASAFCLGE